jgi:signal transduction histidine kinase
MLGWLVCALLLVVILALIWTYIVRVHLPLLRLFSEVTSVSELPTHAHPNSLSLGFVEKLVTACHALRASQGNNERERAAAREEERLILEVANSVSTELDLNALLHKIITTVTHVLAAERASLFLYDEQRDELWSRVSQGAITQEIRIPATTGLAGACFRSGDVLRIADPYSDPRFNQEVDRSTGHISRNILCIAVCNRSGDKLGVLQLVNKVDGAFTDGDVSRLRAFSAQFAIALENAQLYEALKLLDKAKERVINHLSHELKTPLVILAGVLDLVKRKSEEMNNRALQRSLDRGYRNIARLLSLQEQIDDILQQRGDNTKNEVLYVVETAVDLLDDMASHEAEPLSRIMSLMSERLEDMFGIDEVSLDTVHIPELLEACVRSARESSEQRELNWQLQIEPEMAVNSNEKMLATVVGGLVKNAVENAPDEGTLTVSAQREDGQVIISICDQGVGITEENSALVFGGFFHTQTTEDYSSKRAFEFNAGGNGTDLLRIKCLSERHGFDIKFESERCRFIPRDEDACPGRISACSNVASSAECAVSGGSRFTIAIPAI